MELLKEHWHSFFWDMVYIHKCSKYDANEQRDAYFHGDRIPQKISKSSLLDTAYLAQLKTSLPQLL